MNDSSQEQKKRLKLFVIRIALSILIAFVLLRLFFPQLGWKYVAVLAAFLLAGASLREYLYGRKPNQDGGGD